VTHRDLLADLLDHFGRDVEDLRLAIDERGDLILHIQVLAVGAMTAGPPTRALTFDEGSREHVAEGSEAADQASTDFEIGIARLGLLSDSNK